jgi:hypothetical protein
MAEAPVVVATVQGTWFVIKEFRKFRPRIRLQKWEDKINEAMKDVNEQHSNVNINPCDMEKLMDEHARYFSQSPLLGLGHIPS